MAPPLSTPAGFCLHPDASETRGRRGRAHRCYTEPPQQLSILKPREVSFAPPARGALTEAVVKEPDALQPQPLPAGTDAAPNALARAGAPQPSVPKDAAAVILVREREGAADDPEVFWARRGRATGLPAGLLRLPRRAARRGRRRGGGRARGRPRDRDHDRVRGARAVRGAGRAGRARRGAPDEGAARIRPRRPDLGAHDVRRAARALRPAARRARLHLRRPLGDAALQPPPLRHALLRRALPAQAGAATAHRRVRRGRLGARAPMLTGAGGAPS